ncbi:MAG: putative addiction module antidote protein [Ectothiorhodospiraceae bacterium]|nr:putative addiction module antidote protein [Ectothiorhodospiraceae bacterium]
MKIQTKPYNPLDNLLTDSDIPGYLSEAFEDSDPAIFVTALGHVVKHKGVANIANQAGLNRESLYKMLSGKSQPKWDTVQRILKVLDIHFKVAA